jgi:hypothetical protein
MDPTQLQREWKYYMSGAANRNGIVMEFAVSAGRT